MKVYDKDVFSNREKLFVHAVANLFKQREKSFGTVCYTDSDGTSGEYSACKYKNIQDGHITKCAVGWIIPDDMYTTELEGKDVSNIVDMLDLFDLKGDENFWQDVQDAHDNYEINDWPNKFEKIIEDYDLDISISTIYDNPEKFCVDNPTVPRKGNNV